MILHYKTGSLPPHFISLGILLLGISIWRIVVLDWIGVLLFIISFLCLFTKSGIIIDVNKKTLKKYIGNFIFKMGNWENISSLTNIQVIRINETQSMNIQSINRVESTIAYKILFVFPSKKIEIMKGKYIEIIKAAEAISTELQTPLINNTI